MLQSITPKAGFGAIAVAAFGAASRSLIALIWLLVAAFAIGEPAAIAADTMKASDFKMAGDALKMRIVLEFDREPDPKWFLLRGPQAGIDLPRRLSWSSPRR